MDWVYIIDIMLVIGTLVVLLGLMGYIGPQVIKPIEQKIELFSFDGNTGRLEISEDLGFRIVEDYSLKNKLEISFNPGVYYWKFLPSGEIRTIIFDKKTNLIFEKKGDRFFVISDDNLEVRKYREGDIVRKIKSGWGEDEM